MMSPCKGCDRPQKEVGCHSSCKDFKKYRDDLDDLNKKIRSYKDREKQINLHKTYVVSKERRKKGR